MHQKNELQANETELRTLNGELQTHLEELHLECQNWEFKARRRSPAPQDEQSEQDQDPNDHDGEYDGYHEEEWQEGKEEEAGDEAEVDISAADEDLFPAAAATKIEKANIGKLKEKSKKRQVRENRVSKDSTTRWKRKLKT